MTWWSWFWIAVWEFLTGETHPHRHHHHHKLHRITVTLRTS